MAREKKENDISGLFQNSSHSFELPNFFPPCLLLLFASHIRKPVSDRDLAWHEFQMDQSSIQPLPIGLVGNAAKGEEKEQVTAKAEREAIYTAMYSWTRLVSNTEINSLHIF